jgi:hypothetical protein
MEVPTSEVNRMYEPYESERFGGDGKFHSLSRQKQRRRFGGKSHLFSRQNCVKRFGGKFNCHRLVSSTWPSSGVG